MKERKGLLSNDLGLRRQSRPHAGGESWAKDSALGGNYFFDMTLPTSEARADASVLAPSVDWQAALAQHDRWLRTIALARLGEPQAVDEVMQEVALAAVRQKAPLADPEKVAPWLYRLTVTQALLYRRRMGRRRKLTEGFAERVRPSEGDSRSVDPLAWLLAEERRQRVRVALERLPRRDAEILLLKYTEDWSYHEIAARLGIGHSAVEARLHRARGRMRCELAALDVAEVES
jgi:RNA polymerase sigma factor (sigma-70 family)